MWSPPNQGPSSAYQQSREQPPLIPPGRTDSPMPHFSASENLLGAASRWLYHILWISICEYILPPLLGGKIEKGVIFIRTVPAPSIVHLCYCYCFWKKDCINGHWTAGCLETGRAELARGRSRGMRRGKGLLMLRERKQEIIHGDTS